MILNLKSLDNLVPRNRGLIEDFFLVNSSFTIGKPMREVLEKFERLFCSDYANQMQIVNIKIFENMPSINLYAFMIYEFLICNWHFLIK